MNDLEQRIRVRPSGVGYAAEGPGFYVWDEDPRVVLMTVRDLEGGRSGSAQRVVRMSRGPRSGATSNGEALDA